MNRFTVSLAALLCSANWLHAENWPQFREPTGQDHSSETGLPLKWSESESIAWRTALPGEGWSSPIVWGDAIHAIPQADGQSHSLDFTVHN